jgi:aryl-alcohol dehydrogenase-like predicted oxidoreductase
MEKRRIGAGGLELRPDSLRGECEASLRRLRVEFIDRYPIHWPYPAHPLDDAFEALEPLSEEGKVRALGVSLGNLAVAWVLAQPGVLLAARAEGRRGAQKSLQRAL